MNTRQIILAGGGNEQQSFRVDEFFFSRIPKNGTILYIPVALRGHKLFESSQEWFQNLLRLHKREDIKIIPVKHFDKEMFNRDIDAIYIGGGNTWNLLKEIYESEVYDILIEKIKFGILTYGGSAGAIILGGDISKNPDLQGKEINYDKGLNLLDGYSVVPHANSVDLSDPNILYSKTIALPEDSGVFVTDKGISTISGEPYIS